jgi:pyruvate dehydrogenase E1 component alpha subunit
VKGHVSVDAATYRERGEVERAREQDPLALARARFAARGIATTALDCIVAEAAAEVAQALRVAAAAPPPEPAAAYTDIQDTGAGRWQ